MARADKETAVAELTERFQSSAGAVLTDYRGLTVAQLAELRQALGDNATFSVVKNTLTKIAATEAGYADQIGGLLSGPSAIAFISGDVVEASKGLKEFAKVNQALVIKGGLIDGKPMAPAEIEKLADLESREVLLAKLAGAMKASMTKAAGTFSALPTQMARLLAAYQAQKEAEPAAAAPADTAAADSAPAGGTEPAESAPAEPAAAADEPTDS